MPDESGAGLRDEILRRRGKTVAEPDRPAIGSVSTVSAPHNASRYAQAALEDEVARLLDVEIGSGRNAALNLAAYRMARFVASGDLAEAEVTNRLGEADGGLSFPATNNTIRSGLTAGIRDARSAAPLPRLSATPGVLSTAGGDVPSSWFLFPLQDVVAGRGRASPKPEFLPRSDGCRLFYGAGTINAILGASESGKSWLALYAVHIALAEGQRVVYLDFESAPEEIVGRLRSFGTTDKELDLFAYIRPDEPLTQGRSGADLDAALASHRPALVILDGVNEALTLNGWEPNSNGDVTLFGQLVLRRIVKTGAALVTIDHTGKQPNGPGALGAQAKRALVSGCSIRVEVNQPFGIGRPGKLKLFVDKDRPGHVRALGRTSLVGTVFVSSQVDGSIAFTIEAPDVPTPGVGTFRPTTLMQQVSAVLEFASEPMTQNAILDAVSGNKANKNMALGVLVAEGFVTVTPGPNHSKRHTSIKSYSQASDPKSDRFAGEQAAA